MASRGNKCWLRGQSSAVVQDTQQQLLLLLLLLALLNKQSSATTTCEVMKETVTPTPTYSTFNFTFISSQSPTDSPQSPL